MSQTVKNIFQKLTSFNWKILIFWKIWKKKYLQRFKFQGVDDGIAHLPTVSTIHNEEAQTFHQRPTVRTEKEYYTPHYESSGDGYDLIFPDVSCKGIW